MGTLGRAIYTVGFWIRETGQAIDRLGSSLQGNYSFAEQRDMNSISVGSGTNIPDNSLLHVARSNLSGKVLSTIIRDDVTVGISNIFAKIMTATASYRSWIFHSEGHSAVLHGCTVEEEAFVGMGTTLLDVVIVEKHAIIAAGALVRQNMRIPCGEVWAGKLASFLRKLNHWWRKMI